MGDMVIDKGEYWSIPIQGWRLAGSELDHDLGLTFVGPSSSVLFRIGGRLMLKSAGCTTSTIDIDARQDAGALRAFLRHPLDVTTARAYKDGALAIGFSDGSLLSVPPDVEYEAWEATAKHQEFAIVSLPGGGLAVWAPATSPAR